jgi:hypothetical protein
MTRAILNPKAARETRIKRFGRLRMDPLLPHREND